MTANSLERQIAEHLHALVDLVGAPFIARMIQNERVVDVVGASLTLAQAAKALGFSPKTVSRWCDANRIRSTGKGKSRRIELSEIERFKAQQHKEPG
jgi:excisionase family DNA binding protein